MHCTEGLHQAKQGKQLAGSPSSDLELAGQGTVALAVTPSFSAERTPVQLQEEQQLQQHGQGPAAPHSYSSASSRWTPATATGECMISTAQSGSDC